MRSWMRVVGLIGVVAVSIGPAARAAVAQEPVRSQPVAIPADATALEGIPTVRVDSTKEGATRRVLGDAEAAKNRLTVRVVDGQFYWTSRDNRPLRAYSSGAFTYLSSEPGQYIRLTKLDDKISYVEHVDVAFGSVTWWGELRIEVGK